MTCGDPITGFTQLLRGERSQEGRITSIDVDARGEMTLWWAPYGWKQEFRCDPEDEGILWVRGHTEEGKRTLQAAQALCSGGRRRFSLRVRHQGRIDERRFP